MVDVGAVGRVQSAHAELKRLLAIGKQVGEWTDESAFYAWNKSVTAAQPDEDVDE